MDPNSQQFKKIVELFKETIPKGIVEKVEIVQNF